MAVGSMLNSTNKTKVVKQNQGKTVFTFMIEKRFLSCTNLWSVLLAFCLLNHKVHLDAKLLECFNCNQDIFKQNLESF